MISPALNVEQICASHGNSRIHLLDIALEVQNARGYVSDEDMETIARSCGTHFVEVEGLVSFYAFLSREPTGRIAIRLCNDLIDEFHGQKKVAAAFRRALGIEFGETTPDGNFSLDWTSCIGMSDQAPAALINKTVVTHLSSDWVEEIVDILQRTMDPKQIPFRLGDGANAHPLVRSMVRNNIRRKGPVIFDFVVEGEAIHKALSMTPVEVIKMIKTARLRGRGGAGFPTGLKWEFTRKAPGNHKVIICNADEGEPGTFKDRVILTERASLMIEGMVIAAYAIGASEGIIYLRWEYSYLKEYLEHVLEKMKAQNLLGENIGERPGFNFDIRIQMGAGAYICGEETALISSCEGERGDPKNRPPFPVQKGYLGYPTCVNNVETLCKVTRIVDMGPAWFVSMGTQGSPGTKLLSISGDCASPGVYEFPFGTPLKQVLEEAGARDAIAVQVGGPSGQMVSPDQFNKTICYDDLATGGSVMIFGPRRDPVEIVLKFMQFFCEESCGYCTPCRVGNQLLRLKLECLLQGNGVDGDIDYLLELAQTIKKTSRCGLGQTSPNCVLSSLANFRASYEGHIARNKSHNRLFQPTYDPVAELSQSSAIAGRPSEIF